jgi:hypothetical protein
VPIAVSTISESRGDPDSERLKGTLKGQIWVVENADHVNAETESYAITHFFNVKILSDTCQCFSTIVASTTIMEIAPTRPHNRGVDNPPSIDIHYSVGIHNPSPTIQSIFQASKEESCENRYPW